MTILIYKFEFSSEGAEEKKIRQTELLPVHDLRRYYPVTFLAYFLTVENFDLILSHPHSNYLLTLSTLIIYPSGIIFVCVLHLAQ